MHYWFFGLPGSGKSHLADIFSRMADLPVYDGDTFHTDEDRLLIAKSAFTARNRHAQLERISRQLQDLGETAAVLTHNLADQKSRHLLRSSGAQLVWVRAPLPLVKERLAARTGHHFTADLLEGWIPRLWEDPSGEGDFVIENGENDNVEMQLQNLLQTPGTE